MCAFAIGRCRILRAIDRCHLSTVSARSEPFPKCTPNQPDPAKYPPPVGLEPRSSQDLSVVSSGPRRPSQERFPVTVLGNAGVPGLVAPGVGSPFIFPHAFAVPALPSWSLEGPSLSWPSAAIAARTAALPVGRLGDPPHYAGDPSAGARRRHSVGLARGSLPQQVTPPH